MIKFGVEIIQASKVKFKHNYIETDSLVGCARIISTFKPARGYEVVQITIKEAEVLDLELADYVQGDLFKLAKDGILVDSKGQ